MTLFLAYSIDPFLTRDTILVAYNPIDSSIKQMTYSELFEIKTPIVTYDATTLVSDIGYLHADESVSLNLELIDIGIPLRIITGLSRDEGGEKKWDVWKFSKSFFDSKKDCDSLKKISEGRLKTPDDSEVIRLLSDAAKSLQKAYSDLQIQLKKQEEEHRFFSIEIPVQQIFYNRQHLGINVDISSLTSLLEEAKKEKYTAFKAIGEALNINPSGLNFWNIAPFLEKTDAKHLGEFKESSHLRSYFKIASDSKTSAFASQFLLYTKSNRNIDALTKLIVDGKKTHPTFLTFGTVTGRILVENPHLQQIKKRYRSVLLPDKGKKLVYLDYAQFEPGIIASLSKDKNLISDYNDSDLYTSLSDELFHSSDYRKLCKQIFLSFCYGMSHDRIIKLLTGSNPTQEQLDCYKEVLKSFFDRYSKLEAYKKKLEKQLMKNGYISGAWGNRRNRKGEGSLTYKEKRWCINHGIQSTASLIFKEALVGLSQRFGKDSILLPFHDAVLMQFDENSSLKNTSISIDIMKSAFKKYCPDINPKVTEGDFS